MEVIFSVLGLLALAILTVTFFVAIITVIGTVLALILLFMLIWRLCGQPIAVTRGKVKLGEIRWFRFHRSKLTK